MGSNYNVQSSKTCPCFKNEEQFHVSFTKENKTKKQQQQQQENQTKPNQTLKTDQLNKKKSNKYWELGQQSLVMLTDLLTKS